MDNFVQQDRLHGLCLLEEALACDRKATFSDTWEEDDVFWNISLPFSKLSLDDIVNAQTVVSKLAFCIFFEFDITTKKPCLDGCTDLFGINPLPLKSSEMIFWKAISSSVLLSFTSHQQPEFFMCGWRRTLIPPPYLIHSKDCLHHEEKESSHHHEEKSYRLQT
ncbi:hypothetical protein Tco_0479510 [Tanacetum coccineum]